MANFDQLASLLQSESAGRAPLMLRPPKPGNPVMEQMGGGGFQITPEERAFVAQGDPDKAMRSGIFQFLAGGPMRGMAAHRTSMERSKAEQTQEMLSGAYQRLYETEGRTPADMNEMALFRAGLTGEQPRLFRPQGLQTSFRERTYVDEEGVSRVQPEYVSVDPRGRIVHTEKYGDSRLLTSGKSRAQLTRQQVSDYRNTLDVRDRIESGSGWEQQVLDVIQAIDPDRDVDLENEGAAMALIAGVAPSARLPQYRIDDVTKLAKAYDSVPGDPESQEPARKRLQREHKKRVMDIWRKHHFGETAEEARVSSAARAEAEALAKAEAERRLRELGAPPSASGTAAESAQGRSLYDRAQEIVSYASRPSTSRPGSRALRDEQAPERLQPITSPSVSGVPFEGGRQIGTTLEQMAEGGRQIGTTLEQMAEESRAAVEEHQARRRTGSLERYRRSVKKFKRGDKDRRVLSPLERSLAEIVNGESAVR